MSLFLNLPAPDFSAYSINYSSSLFFIGSCFSENISDKMKNGKFSVNANPFGILYDPQAILSSFKTIVNNEKVADKDILLRNGIYYSWSHHGVFLNTDKNKLVKSINESTAHAHTYLKSCSHIFITLGTAFAYKLKSEDRFVANCHKVENLKFEKVLFSQQECVKYLEEILATISKINKNATLCFTLSPVRHIKNGIIENSHSKANLLSAIQEIVASHNSFIYFPSFEYFMDVFRDYRFFKEDMVHPNAQAINLVFDEFKKSFFSEKTAPLFKEILSIKQGMNHRILNMGSEEVKKFKKTMLLKISNVSKEFENIDFMNEKRYFETL